MILAAARNKMTLREVARQLGVSVRCVRSWHDVGLRNGRVRLPLLRIGHRVFVTEESLDAFQRQVDATPAPSPMVRTAGERRRDQAEAERRMEARKKRRQAAG